MTEKNSTNAEAQEQNEQQGKEKVKIDSGFKRNLMIIGGVFGVAIILVLVIVFSRSAKKEDSQSSVSINASKSTSGKTENEEMSPAMREAIKLKLEKEQRAAAEKGDSVYIAPELLNSTQPVNPLVVQNTAGQPVGQRPAEQQYLVPTQAELDKLSNRRAGMERQLGTLLAFGDLERSAPSRVNFPNQTMVTATASAAPSAVAASPVPVLDAIIGALEIVAAEVASPIDTYKTKYASARIVGGKLSGAFLIGSVTQQEDGLQINFTQMRLGQKTFAIDAIALDEKTSTDAVDANVDRRYMQRFVFPVLTAVATGFAAAKATVDSSSDMGILGAVVAKPAPTTTQAKAAGVAAGLGILSSEVTKAASKPYQIQLDANAPIGILFRRAVSETAKP